MCDKIRVMEREIMEIVFQDDEEKAIFPSHLNKTNPRAS
jgi:hypothetical protein